MKSLKQIDLEHNPLIIKPEASTKKILKLLKENESLRDLNLNTNLINGIYKYKKKVILKILIVGDSAVGKTTLLHRYVEGRFSPDTRLTIGVEFFLKETEIDDKQCTLQFWDFQAQDRFRFMIEHFVIGAKGALLLFDLTRLLTLENLEQFANIVRKGDADLPILFVGTKLDLKDEIQYEDIDYIKSFVKELNMIDFIKISSKSGENVSKAFELLLNNIL